ncbi:MAG: HAD family acid phosphatase [Pseudomonadota bacterium]
MNRPICVFSLALICAACATAPSDPTTAPAACQVDRSSNHEQLSGVLWMQTSAEYAAITRGTFRQAAAALDTALAKPEHTAALEQTEPYADKPPAVILDVDETVLDNSPHQAQRVIDGGLFDRTIWGEWVEQGSAQWVPGAKEFLAYAAERGVTVFLVTNRTTEEEAATRRNLEMLGYPIPADPDQLLTKGEFDTSSEKSERRRHVASTHRILLLLGDDLNDFLPARLDNPADRLALVRQHESRFGRDWFVLPNPNYGSWDRALSARDTDACGQLDHRRSKLEGFRR